VQQPQPASVIATGRRRAGFVDSASIVQSSDGRKRRLRAARSLAVAKAPPAAHPTNVAFYQIFRVADCQTITRRKQNGRLHIYRRTGRTDGRAKSIRRRENARHLRCAIATECYQQLPPNPPSLLPAPRSIRMSLLPDK